MTQIQATETLRIWSDGEQHILHSDEIEYVMEIGREADNAAEAWTKLDDYLSQR